MWKATLAFVAVAFVPATAAAHPDWALDLASRADACEDAAIAARAEAQACRDENTNGGDTTCPSISASNGASYSPDEVDAIAARWDQDVVTLRSRTDSVELHQQAIDAIEVQIRDLGFSHRAADFDAWKRQSEDMRTTAVLQTFAGVWALAMTKAETLEKGLAKLTPKKLKKLIKSVRAWGGEATDAVVDAIGELRGARTKKQKRAAAARVVDVLGKAKDLFFTDVQTAGWAAAGETLVTVLGWTVAAMPAAAAAQAALIVAGAKALFTDLELAAFLYGAGNDIEGLTSLVEGNLRRLRDLHDSATYHVDQAIWFIDDSSSLCQL